MRTQTLHNTVRQELSSEISDGYALLELARGWLKQGNPVVAYELLTSAFRSPEADSDRRLRAQIMMETGRALMMQSQWDQAETSLLEAQRIFMDLEDHQGAAQSARNRANMYFQKGRFRESEDLCQQALEWASAINDRQMRATILNTLGAIKSANGDYREAIKTLRLCLADFHSSGNRIRQGYVLLNIGLTQIEISDFAEAIGSLNQALAIALEEKDLNLVEICYQNISKCYLAQKETNLAKSVIDTARKILPGLNSKALEAELNIIDSSILRLTGDTKGAAKLLEETHELTVEHKLTALQADVLLEQGLLEREKGHNDLAVAKLDAAANQFRQVGLDQGFRKAVQALENLKRKQDAP
jgi:tetratricopeptide (TPR) repeat protein